MRWPVGPAVRVGADHEGARAWVEYKRASAHWYLDTLERLGRDFDFARLLGVEMALDGALAALCGAVDAAQRPVLAAVWALDGRPPKSPGSFPRLKDFTPSLDERPEPLGSLGRALTTAELWEGDPRAPAGWLAKLRSLRNRATHEDTLARFVHVTVGAEESTATGLSVPGESTGVEPVAYLRDAEHRVRELSELLLRVLAELDPARSQVPDRRSATVLASAATISVRGHGGTVSGSAEPASTDPRSGVR